jgi:LAO/AO transport system kinase
MEQNQKVLYETIEEELKRHFFAQKEISATLHHIEKEIMSGNLNPYQAANDLLEKYYGKGPSDKIK